MNRQLDTKNWKESTTKYENNNTIEITLITAANTKVKTMIKTTIKYNNDKIANAIIANRKMNIYKVIAVVARKGQVFNGMEMPYLTGKGITLPFSASISVHEVNAYGDSELIKEINLTSKVIGTDCLEISCENTLNLNGRTEQINSNITFETKLPKYAYDWNVASEEQAQEEEQVQEEEQAQEGKNKMQTIKAKYRLYHQYELKNKNNEIALIKFEERTEHKECNNDLTILIQTEYGINAEEMLQNKLSTVIDTIVNPSKMTENKIVNLKVVNAASKNGRIYYELLITRNSWKFRANNQGEFIEGDLNNPEYMLHNYTVRDITLTTPQATAKQEESNVSRETSDDQKETHTNRESKNMKMQLIEGKIKSVTTHDGSKEKIKCINLFHANDKGTALFEIVGKEHLKLSVTLDKQYGDALLELVTNWDKIIKLIRNPYFLKYSAYNTIKVRLYNEKTDKSDFEIRIGRQDVEFKDNRYFINGWSSLKLSENNQGYLYNYIFYNRARVMRKAHKMVKKYKKHDVIIPLSLAIKYYANCEKVYQGTAKNEEEATREIKKEINRHLNKEKLIHYSIPYAWYKDQHFEDAVKFYDKYIEICEKNITKKQSAWILYSE